MNPDKRETADVVQETDEALQARLQAALVAKGDNYTPRTRHLKADGSARYTNRLILESSPYLLQHAHNPVNWFAWSDEAFATAVRLGRPVFLSVGYSTCHWCHVMEEESFEDEEIARYLNEHYVCIKVDREERPDIDATYMAFVQALTGRGGWPMSVWLMPTREPFFGGTYFPPRAGVRGSRQGFLELSKALFTRFDTEKSAVMDDAQGYARHLQASQNAEVAGELSGVSVLEAARKDAARRFDPVNGGTAGAPKFPSSLPVRLLLRMARRDNDVDARNMALTTLENMRAGGMYDQVGGGFHRYSTDPVWRVPHFEKMLYDNGLLARAYLEGAQAAGDANYAQTTRDVLDYVLREMTAPDGTFYSATDADSLTASGQREEGVFFTWTPSELDSVLNADDAKLAKAWFGVTDAGHLDGRSVLHISRRQDDVARELNLTREIFDQRIEHIRAALTEGRNRRPAPLRDDKVIVAWNAMVVSALARAAIVLGDAGYAKAAERCARVLVNPWRENKRLSHGFFAGKPQGEAFADDTALLSAALLDVFEVTSESAWLQDATTLMDHLETAFGDNANGGYFLSATHHEQLLLRDKSNYDGATPSPSSIAAMTWLRLYALTDEDRYRQRAETTMRAFSQTLARHPAALGEMLLAVDWSTDAAQELVIVVPEGRGVLASAARPLLDVLQQHFVPNMVLVVATESIIDSELSKRIPWLHDRRMQNGQATAYLCERGTCQLPTSDPQQLAQQLTALRPHK